MTRQALRRHRRSLLGPAATQLVAACVIAAMIDTRSSLSSSLPAGVRARTGLRDVMDPQQRSALEAARARPGRRPASGSRKDVPA